MAIGGYSINDYWLLFYKWLLMDIFIGGYWYLLMAIILVAIGGYSIDGYQCLLMATILVTIGGYSIGGYQCLLMGIILVVIGGYYINAYW